MVTFFCESPTSNSPNRFLLPASSPFVGSSKSRIAGCRNSTFANAAFCCSPPLRSYGCFLSKSSIPSNAITFCQISCLVSPKNVLIWFCSSNTSYRSSSTVFLTKSVVGSCGSTPKIPFRNSFSLYFARDLPKNSIVPFCGFKSPPSRCNVVVFPLPFPPIKAKIAPSSTKRLRWSTTSTSACG